MEKTKEQGLQIAASVAANTGKMTPVAFEARLRDWYKANGKKLINLLGDQRAAIRLLTVAASQVSRNAQLLECDMGSFARCLLYSAETDLYPGAAQECAFVPLRNGDTQRLEANWWPMYQGLIKLMYAGGAIHDIGCAVVYEADKFDYQLGMKPKLHHVPFLGPRKDRGGRVCVYAVAKTAHGYAPPIVLTMDFVEGIKKRSRGAKSQMSPWNGNEDDYDAMARKTAIKQLSKYIPKSPRLIRAIELDNVVEGKEPVATIAEINLDDLMIGGSSEQQLDAAKNESS